MTKNIFIFLLCVTTYKYTYSQDIQPGTTLTIQQGTTFSTAGDLAIGTNANLVNEGTIRLVGDLVNNGNRDLNGTFVLNGKSDQYLSGTDSFSFHNLELSTAHAVTLESRVAITGRLTFSRGVLHCSDEHPVVFTHAAQNPVESLDGYINGTAIMQERSVGTNTIDFLGARINAGSDLGDVSIIRTTGDSAITPIGNDSSIASKWLIASSVKTAGNRDVSFSWLPVFDNKKDLESLELFATHIHNKERYVRLTNHDRYKSPVSVTLTTEMRICTREELDYLNRTFTLSTGGALTSVDEQNKITTFPNPATDHINLLLENYEDWATNVRVVLTDAYGKVISEKVYPLNGNIITITDIAKLNAGVYRLNVSRGQRVQVVNFVKY